MKRLVSWAMVITLLMNVFALAFFARPARAAGTIYIRADGSIDPSTAPVLTLDNVTYFFVDDIYDPIVVERDNIVIDGIGCTLQGTGADFSEGIDLSARSNITIKNVQIKAFDYGIRLISSSNNSMTGNNITNNDYGIELSYSSNNSVSGNDMTDNGVGVHLYISSDYNKIDGNNIGNNYYGIVPEFCSYNSVSGNSIVNNEYSIRLYSSFGDVWDNGYPSGGNYWSDYMGQDLHSGLFQNETGSDGMGDTPYVIDASNRDNYPLMKPCPWDLHDIGITYVGRYWDFVPVVLPLKTIAGIGFALHASVLVVNYGSFSEVFNSTLFANNTGTNTTVIGSATNVVLTAKSSAILDFIWNTAAFAKGNYTISASVSVVPGETCIADNSFKDGKILIAVPGDVNGDGKVDLKDVFTVAKCYGRVVGQQGWNANYDINDDGKIDLKDYFTACKNFGKSW